MDLHRTAGEAKNFSVKSALSFLVVGGLATGVHYLITAILVFYFSQPVVLASAVGFTVSAILNYLMNAKVTFRSKQPHRSTAPRFFLTAGVGLLLNSMVLWLLVALKFHPVIAQLLTTIGVMIWNYCINGLWTFKKRAN